jgi:hypothetical protein
MCGASTQQTEIANEQQSLGSTLQSNYNQQFAAQSGVLQNLNNIYTPIAEAGPNQQGFGGQELAALNTQSGEGVGANYAKASQALNNTLGAQGGGNEYLPNGAQAALKGSLASSAANQLSQQQTQITEANYGQGRQNYNQATAGLQALGQQYNPTGFAGQATGANTAGFNEQMENSQETSQEFGEIAGGVGSLMGGVTGVVSALKPPNG